MFGEDIGWSGRRSIQRDYEEYHYNHEGFLGNGWASGRIRHNGFCNNKQAIRGLHKIALEILAFYNGVEEARRRFYDAVRLFVRKGKGQRIVLLIPCGDTRYRNEVIPPCGPPEQPCVVGFRLGAIRFVVDLSPDQRHLDTLRAICRAGYSNDWTWVPVSESDR